MPARSSLRNKVRSKSKTRFAASEALESRWLLSAKGASAGAAENLNNGSGQIIDPWDTSKVPQYLLNGRWTSTATNGAIGGLGSGMTLTYSIVPDGTTLYTGSNSIGEANTPSVLQARLTSLYGSMANALTVIQAVFAQWSAISGINYVYEPNDDGVAYNGNNGILGVRGDVRIGAHPLDGASGVLAYNQFPANGSDMVIDSNDLSGAGYMANTSSSSLRLRNVMAHEHGHGLGFLHVDPTSQTKLMEPFISTAYDGPQFEDTLAAQRSYGDAFEKGVGNNSAANAVNRGTLGDGTDTIGTNTFPISKPTGSVSISSTSDQDWYKFTLSTAKILNITLAPTGPAPYLTGPQNGATSSYDPKVQANLQVQVISSNGTTVLATANATAAGVNEVVTNLNLPAGTFYLKVSTQSGSADNVQTYMLSNVITPGGVPVTGDVVNVSPNPRQTSVNSIEIDFSEAVSPSSFDKSDLSFTREGIELDLTAATLTTSDNIHWFLNNISGITSRAGNYAFSVAGNVFTTDGRAVIGSPGDSWIMNAVLGTAASETIRLTRTGDVNVFFNGAGVADYSFSITGWTSMQVLAGGGDDTIFVDVSGGSGIPFPNGGLTVDGGTHTTADVLHVKGTFALDTYNVLTSNTVTRGSTLAQPTITHSNITGLEFTQGTFKIGADLNGVGLKNNPAATTTINVSQHMGDLNIPDGAAVSVPQNGSRILNVTGLSIGATGKLDLFDNDLRATGVPLATVEGYVAGAYNGGAWNGAGGIFSTTAKNNAGFTTGLGVMSGADFNLLNGGTFDGETVAAGDALVKYTYFGDVNFDGATDGLDYIFIDNGFLNHLTGWANGDVNYDGVVDGLDYIFIDNANLSGGPGL